jgi:hypothetical protein
MSDGWEWGTFAVLTVLFLILTSLGTLALPLLWVDHANKVKNVHALIREMTTTYGELRSEGPVSARHLLESLNKSAEAGVAWPGPVYALLDDVMGRTGRL